MKTLVLSRHRELCKIPGAISAGEGAHLAWLAAAPPLADKKKLIVEIGSLRGKSTCFMASALKQLDIPGELHAVDLWKLGGPTQDVQSHGRPKQWRFFKMHVIQFGVGDIVTPHMCESTRYERKWRRDKRGQVDLLHIDGGHSYEACLADYRAWAKYVKVGGYLAMHDNVPWWPGVMQVIHENILNDSGEWGEFFQVYRLFSARKLR